jgi:thiol:disulfide interchange protein DsbD
MHHSRTRPAALCLAALACLLLPPLVGAQTRFEDPLGGKLLGPGSLLGKNAGGGVTVDASLVPSGERQATLRLHVKLPPGSHTYPAQPTVSKGGTFKPTKFVASEVVGLAPISELAADRPPKVRVDRLLKETFEEFHDEVVFLQKFQIAADAKPEDVLVRGMLNLQVCDRSCRDVEQRIEVRLADAEAAPPAESIAKPKQPFVDEAQPLRGKNPGPAKWKFELAPADAQPGETVTLSVRVALEEGWHTYPQHRQTNEKPTKFTLKETPGLKALGEAFEADHAPKVKPPDPEAEKANLPKEIFTGQVTWTREFEVTDANYGLAGSVQVQVCNERQCLAPKTLRFYLGAVEKPPEVRVAARGLDADTKEPSAGTDKVAANDLTGKGLVPFLITAVTFGFLSLLTPCVFPMVPITISFFLKRAESEHHRPVWMASIYCLGIVATFTALGLIMAVFFGATSLTALANNPWLNIGIAGLLVFFGMNMLGMFEIRMPSFLLNWSSGKEQAGGVLGTLFMSFTFTLVSFTCTFAFAGSLLVLAANGDYTWPIIGMLAFSLAFASPFFFLALFPGLVKKLPKSGGWMNAVKVTIGLVEVGAAFKFLSVADLSWNRAPALFDDATVLSAWIVISFVAGLYLLGLFRLSHDTPVESISPLRLMIATSFLGLAGFLAAGLFAPKTPESELWANIKAFLPGEFKGGKGEIGPYKSHGELKFALDVDKAIAYAQANNMPLLYDFTGINCTNCRKMELTMEKDEIKKRLEKFVLVQLYLDEVPVIEDDQRAQELKAKNNRLSVEWFGDVAMPSYAIVDPQGKKQLNKLSGLRSKDEFAAFLDQGYERWKQGQSPTQVAQRE